MKLKAEDLIALAAYLDKNCRTGEVSIESAVAHKGLVFKFSNNIGEERIVKLFDVEGHMLPRISFEEQLLTSKR